MVACGGGVVLEPANRITLRNTGIGGVPGRARSTRLQASVVPPADRPLIPSDGDLESLLASASRSTGSSRPTWWTASGTPEEVADAIVEELRWSA